MKNKSGIFKGSFWDKIIFFKSGILQYYCNVILIGVFMRIKLLIFLGIGLWSGRLFAQSPAGDLSPNWYQTGFYFGGQLGYVNPNNSHANFTWSNMLFPLISETGSRLFIGYAVNDYFALEAGYSSLVDGKETGGILNKKQHAYLSGFDFLGKGIMPFNQYLSFFLKGGGAYIHQDILDAIYGGELVTYESNVHQWMLVVSPGIDFHITQHFMLEASYTRFWQRQEIHNIDMYSLGLAYTF